MNGLFLDFSPPAMQAIELPSTMANRHVKHLIKFDVYHNIDYFSRFFELEKQLLQYYLEYNNIKKQITCGFKNQAMNGMVYYYREHAIPVSNSCKKGYYLKISGIWETKMDVGITYKIIEYVCDL